MLSNRGIEELKKIVPNIKVNKQPETALSELIELENKYKMNTIDAIKLRIEMDEHVHFDENYFYLNDWETTWLTYKIHGGDETLINTIK